jgi:endo-alpha-1,4-polygalactosaminidase (GH114 family)
VIEVTSEHFWVWVVLADIVVTGAAYAVVSKVFVAAVKGAMRPTEEKVNDLIDGQAEIKGTQEDLKQTQRRHTETLDAMGQKIYRIEYQVQPNNGTTLRDAANRTEAAVKELDTKVNNVNDRVSRIEGGQGRS